MQHGEPNKHVLEKKLWIENFNQKSGQGNKVLLKNVSGFDVERNQKRKSNIYHPSFTHEIVVLGKIDNISGFLCSFDVFLPLSYP